MNKTDSKNDLAASQRIIDHISELTDWRGKVLDRLRNLILAAAPELTEEWKWKTPVWSYHGNVVAAGAFKDHLKLNFFKGASLKDPKKLFNAGLEAKTSRGIDIKQGSSIDESALQELVRAAVVLNAGGKRK